VTYKTVTEITQDTLDEKLTVIIGYLRHHPYRHGFLLSVSSHEGIIIDEYPK
jgi:hypothetical protein